jgi:hypothetical protein
MKIKITNCSDSQMWYAKFIGKEFTCLKEDAEGYWCREPAGYLNVVKREDAQVVTNEI